MPTARLPNNIGFELVDCGILGVCLARLRPGVPAEIREIQPSPKKAGMRLVLPSEAIKNRALQVLAQA